MKAVVFNKSNKKIKIEQIQNSYITENVTLEELAITYNLDSVFLVDLAKEEDWLSLRKKFIQEGMEKIQNDQVDYGKQLMDMGATLNKLKTKQLTEQTDAYVAYYAKHGHLNMISSADGSILRDMNGIPIPMKIPNVTREIAALKEGILVSDGLRKLMAQVEATKVLEAPKVNAIDITPKKTKRDTLAEYEYLFNPDKESPEES